MTEVRTEVRNGSAHLHVEGRGHPGSVGCGFGLVSTVSSGALTTFERVLIGRLLVCMLSLFCQFPLLHESARQDD